MPARHGAAMPRRRARRRRRRRATAWRSRARRCRRCPTTGARTSSSHARARRRARRSCGGAARSARPLDDLATRRRQGRRSRARAGASERGDDASADMLFWVEAVQRSIESHHRDLAQDAAGDAAALERRLQTHRGDGARHGQRHGVRLPARSATAGCCRSAISLPRTALDPSCYDLLASEARLASFIAIAKGDVPARHWFRLGREVTPIGRGAALVSWSGSMFEYLMPSLVMRAPLGSLLEQTNRLVVRRQIDYGDEPRRAVGHLGIGLQRARHGTHLPVLQLRRAGPRLQARPQRERWSSRPTRRRWPPWSIRPPRRANFARLAALGARGRYGFYEALDFTPSRLPEGQARGDRARLHGASPGHDDRGHRQRAARRRHARALPRRADHAGDRAAAAGAHAARRRGRPSAGRGSAAPAPRRRSRAAVRAPPAHSARRQPVRRTCCPTAATR